MRDFKAKNKCDRLVIVWCASTEIYIKPGPQHATIEQFEKAMEKNDDAIAPSMLYAWAAIMEGIPFCMGAPNLCVDTPALIKLAQDRGVPISGKDFKTGQTWMKTIVAPGLKARMLGLRGWYSTNILGNRDGEVLDDPQSFKTKEESKLSVLHTILQPDLYPDLYKDFTHVVRINYYPPRGDNKEGWDNIDIVGWMNYPMQIKILPLPRLDSRRADRSRSRAVLRLRAPRRHEGNPGMAVVLLQEPDGRGRPGARARSLHPADEAEEHAQASHG
jgi:Myo-inositol-1-phosphate synthase